MKDADVLRGATKSACHLDVTLKRAQFQQTMMPGVPPTVCSTSFSGALQDRAHHYKVQKLLENFSNRRYKSLSVVL
jgi:hypothetical protein